MPMKPTHIATLLLALAATGCNKPQAPVPTASLPRPAQEQAPSAAQKAKVLPPQATPEEIAEIEATGRTGLWSDVNEVCIADARKGIRATLYWNVKDSGAERVIVYAVDRAGKEKNFGRGGPVGRKQTGPWLRPGVSFKIRAADTQEELGKVLIGEKPC